jgi:hypothetical protein
MAELTPDRDGRPPSQARQFARDRRVVVAHQERPGATTLKWRRQLKLTRSISLIGRRDPSRTRWTHPCSLTSTIFRRPNPSGDHLGLSQCVVEVSHAQGRVIFAGVWPMPIGGFRSGLGGKLPCGRRFHKTGGGIRPKIKFWMVALRYRGVCRRNTNLCRIGLGKPSRRLAQVYKSVVSCVPPKIWRKNFRPSHARQVSRLSAGCLQNVPKF